MPKAKTANRTARSPINGAEIPLGNHPGNTGGKKGRSGKKKDAWKLELQRIVSSDQVLVALETILINPANPAYVGAIKYASDHGYGKPTESIELTGKDGGPVQLWSFGKRKVAF